jgi:hypothetical protein
LSYYHYFFFHVGDVLVVLDLRADQSLFEAGVAREVINYMICVLLGMTPWSTENYVLVVFLHWLMPEFGNLYLTYVMSDFMLL